MVGRVLLFLRYYQQHSCIAKKRARRALEHSGKKKNAIEEREVFAFPGIRSAPIEHSLNLNFNIYSFFPALE